MFNLYLRLIHVFLAYNNTLIVNLHVTYEIHIYSFNNWKYMSEIGNLCVEIQNLKCNIYINLPNDKYGQ